MLPDKKQIFFHVGLGKTASTWLQNKVFNKLEGIYYVHPAKYRNAIKIINSTTYNKYLVSREMDQQLEREVIKFSTVFPHTTPIIVLRSNESWIASQYRRFVKNGYALSFEEFFDVDNNNGFWKRSDLYFYDKLLILEKYFQHKPLVLFYEDLKTNPFNFIDRIVTFTQTTYSKNRISPEPHHTSYNEKQLKVMLGVSKYLFTKNPHYKGSRVQSWLKRRSRMLLSYLILFPALVIPDVFISKQTLISAEQLGKIKNFYADDWQKCREYARRNNVV
jgi:hypothetical protein